MIGEQIGRHRFYGGDCRDLLADLADCSVDAVVTDPPYGLSSPPPIADVLQAWLDGETYRHRRAGFMGQAWDSMVPGPEIWREVCRVLKPGGYALVAAGTRTVDLMGISLRLAGLEVRDVISWVYWSGFPKSLNVGATDDRWSGYGTALKPAVEPFLLVRRPLEGTYAENLRRWNVGALNVDGCRFAYGDPIWPGPTDRATAEQKFASVVGLSSGLTGAIYGDWNGVRGDTFNEVGRFPANLVYVPKPSRAERERYCEGLPWIAGYEAVDRVEGSAGLTPRAGAGRSADQIRNRHPTVKPLRLMRWLCRLITPPAGVVLDPFVGSGTTAIAAQLEGLSSISAELTYPQIPRQRLINATRQQEMTTARTYSGPDLRLVELGDEVAPVGEDLSGQQLDLLGG